MVAMRRRDSILDLGRDMGDAVTLRKRQVRGGMVGGQYITPTLRRRGVQELIHDWLPGLQHGRPPVVGTSVLLR
jgi:hypothetical protein